LTASKRNYEEEVAKLPAWQQKEAKPFRACCPVCRESIEDVEVEPLFTSKPPKDLENAPKFVLTNELKSLQQEMSRLYLRQKQRGGIIDLEAEETTVISLGIEEQQAAAHNARRQVQPAAPASAPNNRQSNQVNLAARLRNQQLAASKNREKMEKDSSDEDSEKTSRPIGRHNKKRHHHRHRHANTNGKAGQGSAATAPSSSNIPNASGGKNR
jgi:E3 ubiquitin-protein ligase RNF25